MANEKELTTDVEGKSGGGKAKLIIMVFGALLLAGGGAGAALFLMKGGLNTDAVEAQEAQRAPALYLTLKPPFVANYTAGKRQRYLQVEMTLVTRDQAQLPVFETHMPMIRNDIVTFLSQQNFDELREPDSRETLRQVLVELLQSKLEEETGETGVEDILFTAFVMQ